MPDHHTIEIDDIGGPYERGRLSACRISEVGARTVIRVCSSAPKTHLPSLVPPGLGGEVRVLALGPTEWWVVSDRIEGGTLRGELERHAGWEAVAVVDLSCAIKGIRLEGSAVQRVLAKGCGLDLDPSHFAPGRCTRTRLAQLAVVVDCTDPEPCFDMYVARSYFKWLHAWLVDAAGEFHNPV
jgi:sarcosine oxidase, subunit gamma